MTEPFEEQVTRELRAVVANIAKVPPEQVSSSFAYNELTKKNTVLIKAGNLKSANNEHPFVSIEIPEANINDVRPAGGIVKDSNSLTQVTSTSPEDSEAGKLWLAALRSQNKFYRPESK